MVQLLSLSKFVLQPQASQVHRCPAEPDSDESPRVPVPAERDDDVLLLSDDLSIIEMGWKLDQ